MPRITGLGRAWLGGHLSLLQELLTNTDSSHVPRDSDGTVLPSVPYSTSPQASVWKPLMAQQVTAEQLLCARHCPGPGGPVTVMTEAETGPYAHGSCAPLVGRSEVSVAQSCPPLCDPMDCSPPGSSVLGILQVRILVCALPCPPPGDLPNPGMEPGPPALQVDSLLSEPPEKPSLDRRGN